jgi:hypothetical protein
VPQQQEARQNCEAKLDLEVYPGGQMNWHHWNTITGTQGNYPHKTQNLATPKTKYKTISHTVVLFHQGKCFVVMNPPCICKVQVEI